MTGKEEPTSHATNTATAELLAIRGFARSFAAGMNDVKAVRTTHWRKVREALRIDRARSKAAQSK
jgi:hypothetical protein